MINIEKLLKSKHIEVQMLNISQVNGVFVKEFREQHNLTQVALANILGVTKKCIEKWEQGTNNIRKSNKILLKLLFDNPELIEKVYSVKVYEDGEKAVEFKTVAQTKFISPEPIAICFLPHINYMQESKCEYVIAGGTI